MHRFDQKVAVREWHCVAHATGRKIGSSVPGHFGLGVGLVSPGCEAVAGTLVVGWRM
jgi:hypothetical protein